MEWISVNERLPPEETWIIGGNLEGVECGIWLDDKGFTLPHCNYLCVKITHWMPFPEPPKKE